MSTMPIAHIDDWEMRLARQDAFWQCEIIDRPVVLMSLPKEQPEVPVPEEKNYADIRDRWYDAEYHAQRFAAAARNTNYLGDALPNFMPNLGPEVFSAFLGSEMEFTPFTSYSIPLLDDWSQVDKVKFSPDNPFWQAINRMTDVYLEAGKDTFYTGMTDLHPGGDAIAAFRDPLRFNMDMIEAVDEVKQLLEYVNKMYFFVYDYFFNKLKAQGQAICTWAGIVSTKKWYVPSNDFSCMISKAMFDDIFLPGIAEECRHMEASIYHLDGPGALQHLDSLLSIPELNAIQWVYGTGNGRATDWLPVFKKCQAAGKGIQLFSELDELETIMTELRPEGVFMAVGVPDRDTADAVLKRVAKWK